MTDHAEEAGRAAYEAYLALNIDTLLGNRKSPSWDKLDSYIKIYWRTAALAVDQKESPYVATETSPESDISMEPPDSVHPPNMSFMSHKQWLKVIRYALGVISAYEHNIKHDQALVSMGFCQDDVLKYACADILKMIGLKNESELFSS